MSHPFTRDDLSFTKRIPRDDFPEFPPIICNWAPPPELNVNGAWNRGFDLGRAMVSELADLARQDETEAYDAVRFALNSTTWRPGWGAEMGFSDEIARLAVLGLRHLAAGGAAFEPNEEWS
ncbi:MULTISPECIES: hypothetical protein [unclassified Pseudomonas]|uniref:hypothetical protein n=1 Tax=unclassified Pseudomonas TaxID=196821 RepID=UPI00244C2399|nr:MULTISPECIES: hypothetical protein [unclassified Pseudomonas]MDH0304720.1 hypothetical protein [Pseudomonas sp. GD04091]MDH1986905.1 hypothetical protein [Pseudomonas sp. GD03689]